MRASPPFSRACSTMPPSVSAPRAVTAHTATSRRNSSSLGIGASRYSAGITRSLRSYSRWNPWRPQIARSPVLHSASSMILAGFQLHIPPELSPSKWRDPSGPRSRISPSTSSARPGLSSITRPRHGCT